MVESGRTQATSNQAEIFNRLADANAVVLHLECTLEQAKHDVKVVKEELKSTMFHGSPPVEHEGQVAEWVAKIARPLNRQKFREVLESIPEISVRGVSGEVLFRPKVLDLCMHRTNKKEWGDVDRDVSEVLDEKPGSPTFEVRSLSSKDTQKTNSTPIEEVEPAGAYSSRAY